MSTVPVHEIAIEPIIHYPQTAEPGKAYLMTVDLRPVLDNPAAWPYEREEYVVNCRVNGGELFTVEPLGDATIILHRFGGTYGPARFVLTAADAERKGAIRVALVNGWGVPLDEIVLSELRIAESKSALQRDEISLASVFRYSSTGLSDQSPRASPIEIWKESIRANLRRLPDLMNESAISTLYGALGAATLEPLITNRLLQGDSAAIGLLFETVGGVGGNLIANNLQQWREITQPELEQELFQKALADQEWRDALDHLYEKLGLFPTIRSVLSQVDKDRFVDRFQTEVTRLGISYRYEEQLDQLSSGEPDHEDIHVRIHQADKADDFEIRRVSATRRRYLEWIYNRCNTLSLVGIDSKVGAYETTQSLNLSSLYVVPNIMTSVLLNEVNESFRDDTRSFEARGVTALEAATKYRHLVLLGEPGSGKSTFVNYLASMMARACTEEEPAEWLATLAPWEHGALLPIRIVLRDFAASGLPLAGEPTTAQHLWDYICRELEGVGLTDFVEPLANELHNQGGLILLDGLDEMPEVEQRRAQIVQVIEDCIIFFPHCRILVTSRTYAYQQQWRLDSFVVAELAPFSENQIGLFIDRWYMHMGELGSLKHAEVQARAEQLKRTISVSERLRELANRPLLLSLIASLHAWRGSLPEHRGELYADAVDLLLDRWESQHVMRNERGEVSIMQPGLAEYLAVAREKVRTLLNRLAYEAQSSQTDLSSTADIAESTLIAGLIEISPKRDLRPGLLVDYLSQRAGLLVPRSVKVYTFAHRTFQEYLAACHLTEDEYPEKLAVLVRQDPERWREVALLAGAKAGHGSPFAVWSLIDALCFRDPDDVEYSLQDVWGAQLAGQVLIESANLAKLSRRNQTKIEHVRHCLVHALRYSAFPALERTIAGCSLAKLGDPRSEVMTVENMQFCWIPSGPFLRTDDKNTMAVLPYDYWMGRHPVTNAQFQLFVAAGGFAERRYWLEAEATGYWRDGIVIDEYGASDRNRPYDYGEPFSLPNHPVVGITWYESVAYCRWATDYLRASGLLHNLLLVRLPTSLEWEKAARGGIQVPYPPVTSVARQTEQSNAPQLPNAAPQRDYPWGNEADLQYANFALTTVGATSAVGCFPQGASLYGIEDMSGNVWEWTEGEEQDGQLQARGGAWSSPADEITTATCLWTHAHYRDNRYGFRCVIAAISR